MSLTVIDLWTSYFHNKSPLIINSVHVQSPNLSSYQCGPEMTLDEESPTALRFPAAHSNVYLIGYKSCRDAGDGYGRARKGGSLVYDSLLSITRNGLVT